MEQAQPPVRSILSCTFCRQKKLRCDRLRPCNSCTKRGLQCAYVNPAPPPRNTPTRSTKQLNQRIRQLESLVNSLGNAKDDPPKSDVEIEPQHGNADDVITNDPGKIQVGEAGVTYVSGAHWAALQDSITELRDYLEPDSPLTYISENQGPALLLGLSPPGGKENFLEFVPPKHVADRLVSWFFNSLEPGVVIIHGPTFQKEYNLFWDYPQDVSLTWLSLLFSIMCLATHLHQRFEGEVADLIGDPKEMANNFRLQAAYCLIKDKYTTPSKYTIEALLMYGQTEYFRSPDAQHELWVLFGVAMRLAMRIGIHRDGSRYPGISCFEAEMRRRIWALMSQLETLLSFQMGLPRMIHGALSDTQLPRNLLDNDFDENSSTLPPPRPDTDFTPVSYMIAKSRISGVFGLITDYVASTLPGSHQSVLQLDNQLNEAYAAAPANLQFRGVGQSVTELPHIIIARYNLDILYQKSRCVLHRNYLYDGRSDRRYVASRRICIDSAIKLLRHHATIDAQVQPGGVLCQHQWYFTSLTTHDFVLAAMILCLEMHYNSKGSGQIGEEAVYSKDELLSTLQTSRQVWSKYKAYSAEATQAWRSISIMLGKLHASTTPGSTALDSYNTLTEKRLSNDDGAQPQDPLDIRNQGVVNNPTPESQLDFDTIMGLDADISGEMTIDNTLWDFSKNIDWVQWDATVQNLEMAGSKASV
ncbi:Zn(II)2Cys6 transcription factor [Aspergillus lucknowensis]|uniref:Fungal-specific transcription factor domain-containing protein n=1 Tax=Aspergillus lucknowensis TaxID=176173 RepID=A0ABR4LR73_9EURO